MLHRGDGQTEKPLRRPCNSIENVDARRDIDGVRGEQRDRRKKKEREKKKIRGQRESGKREKKQESLCPIRRIIFIIKNYHREQTSNTSAGLVRSNSIAMENKRMKSHSHRGCATVQRYASSLSNLLYIHKFTGVSTSSHGIVHTLADRVKVTRAVRPIAQILKQKSKPIPVSRKVRTIFFFFIIIGHDVIPRAGQLVTFYRV